MTGPLLSWGVEPTAAAVGKYFCPDSEAKLEKSLVCNHEVPLEFVELLLGNWKTTPIGKWPAHVELKVVLVFTGTGEKKNLEFKTIFQQTNKPE